MKIRELLEDWRREDREQAVIRDFEKRYGHSPFEEAPPQKRARRVPTQGARLLTTAEAATYLNVSQWQLRRLVHEGELHHIPGKPWRFDVRDLDGYIARKRERL